MRSEIQARPVARVARIARGVDPGEVGDAVESRDSGSGLFCLPDEVDPEFQPPKPRRNTIRDAMRAKFERPEDDGPDPDLAMLAAGTNFLMDPERNRDARYRPMGDGEEIQSRILDAHG
jgi:hypothetical protein